MPKEKIGYFKLTFQGLGNHQYTEKVTSAGTEESVKRWYKSIGRPIIAAELIRWVTPEEQQQASPCSCY